MGGILLDFLGHDHRRQEGAAEHDAHDGVLDQLVHVGDLVHGVILQGNGDGRPHDDVVLLFTRRRTEGEIEKQLVGALGVVDELGQLRA